MTRNSKENSSRKREEVNTCGKTCEMIPSITTEKLIELERSEGIGSESPPPMPEAWMPVEEESYEELTRSSSTRRTLHLLKSLIGRSFEIDNAQKQKNQEHEYNQEPLYDLSSEKGVYYCKRLVNNVVDEEEFDPFHPKKKQNSQAMTLDDGSQLDSLNDTRPRTKHDIMRIYYQNVRQREEDTYKMKQIQQERMERRREMIMKEKNEREYNDLKDFLKLPTIERMKRKKAKEEEMLRLENRRNQELSSRKQKLLDRMTLSSRMYKNAVQRKASAQQKLETLMNSSTMDQCT